MEKSGVAELLKNVAATEAIARKLRDIERGAWPVSFSHVLESAQPFLAAVITQQVNKTLWIICPSVHSQETLYESLLNWQPGALFLPEAEFAAIENILPDPEIAAERLALSDTNRPASWSALGRHDTGKPGSTGAETRGSFFRHRAIETRRTAEQWRTR